MRQQWRVRRHHGDDRSFARSIDRRTCGHIGELAANRNAGDRQLVSRAEVALHEHSDGVALNDARRGADAALEAEAAHARAAADVALGHGARPRAVERGPHVLLLDVESRGVIETRVARLANDRLVPRNRDLESLIEPCEQRVAHRADAPRVGDRDWSAENAALLHPVRADEIAEAIASERAREHRVPLFPLRPDDRYAGAHGMRAVAGDDRRVADFDARYV